MRKKLCNEFSRGFFFFSSSPIFTHSFLLSNVVVGISFFSFCCRTHRHTGKKAHRWKIIRKINLFSDGFYFVCCFSSRFLFSKSIFDTIMSYFPLFFPLFYVLLHTQMLEQALAGGLFSCTTSLSSHSVYPAKDENEKLFFLLLIFVSQKTQPTNKRKRKTSNFSDH